MSKECTTREVSLSQTSKVTFEGVKATTFAVVSEAQVTATVPAGAVTGRITIMTTGGTAGRRRALGNSRSLS